MPPANEELRAFISLREDEALREAEEADSGKAADSGAEALAGVPLAIKDLIDVRGMRTTAASRVLEDDAPATGGCGVRAAIACGRSDHRRQDESA